jgi:hypothetical protein
LVKFTLELAGDVASFTPSVHAQIQGVIAAFAAVDPSAVDVTISSGSVIIDVKIQTPAVTAASVQSSMASATSSPSSATLMFANVTGVSIAVLAVLTPPIVADISRPPSPSPSPTTPISPIMTDALAAFAEMAVETSGSMGIIIGAVVGVIVIVGVCIGLAIVLRRKRSQRPKQTGRVQDLSLGVVIELMAPRAASRTKSTFLPESLDPVLLKTRVRRLRPMLRPGQGQSWILHSPGVLRGPLSDCEMRITAGRLYLEQKDAADGADSSGALEQWPLAALTSVRRRRHEMCHTALELVMAASQSGHQSGGAVLGAQGSVVLEFHSHEEREQAVRTLVGQKPHLRPRDEQLPGMTEKWHYQPNARPSARSWRRRLPIAPPTLGMQNAALRKEAEAAAAAAASAAAPKNVELLHGDAGAAAAASMAEALSGESSGSSPEIAISGESSGSSPEIAISGESSGSSPRSGLVLGLVDHRPIETNPEKTRETNAEKTRETNAERTMRRIRREQRRGMGAPQARSQRDHSEIVGAPPAPTAQHPPQRPSPPHGHGLNYVANAADIAADNMAAHMDAAPEDRPRI